VGVSLARPKIFLRTSLNSPVICLRPFASARACMCVGGRSKGEVWEGKLVCGFDCACAC